MWWVTESHALEMPLAPGEEERRMENVYYHRWEVTGQKEVDGTGCWCIGITPIDGPRSGRAQSGWHAEIYIAKSDSGVKRVTVTVSDRYRGGRSDRIDTYCKDYKGDSPVIVEGVMTHVPLDVLIPRSSDVPQTWKDERTGAGYAGVQQEFVNAHGGRSVLMAVRPDEGSGVRSIRWQSGCPWWVEWRSQRQDGRVDGMWYSGTVDWKGKDSGEGVPNPKTK
jgi:hypothetical protein